MIGPMTNGSGENKNQQACFMSFPLFRAEGLRQQGKNASENAGPWTEAEYARTPREERNLQTQRENWQTA
jgi:hypothetical protein